MISTIIKAQSNPNTKPQRDYYLLDTYQVLEVAGTKRIIKKTNNKNDIRFICAYEDLFEEINLCHLSVGHGGIN